MLELVSRPGVYESLEKISAQLTDGLAALFSEAGVPCTMNRVGSMFTGFFTDRAVIDYETAKTSDKARFGKFFHAMLDRGVYLAPSQFEAAFVSTAHDGRALDKTLSAAREALRAI